MKKERKVGDKCGIRKRCTHTHTVNRVKDLAGYNGLKAYRKVLFVLHMVHSHTHTWRPPGTAVVNIELSSAERCVSLCPCPKNIEDIKLRPTLLHLQLIVYLEIKIVEIKQTNVRCTSTI